jgi:hypothetical protein
MSKHIANGQDMLARATAAIDINSPKLASYDRWIALFRAMLRARETPTSTWLTFCQRCWRTPTTERRA